MAISQLRFPSAGNGKHSARPVLITEFTLVLWLRGLTIKEYLANLDPVTGTAYYLTLALFAVMPLIVKRGPDHKARR